MRARSTIAVLSLLFVSLAVRAEERKPEGRPPNILLILADDMGYGDLHPFNPEAKITAPNLERLAGEGIRLTDAHAPGSVCVPSRYGLLTGRYPFRNRRRQAKEALIEPGRLTLASLLKQKGYATAMVGKWHLSFEGGQPFNYAQPLRGGPVAAGFDRFFGMHASLDIPPYFYIRDERVVEAPTATIAENHSPEVTPIQGAFWRGGDIAPGFKHEAVLPRFTEEAVEYLESRKGQREPFFLYLALPAPHTPWLPDEAFRGKSGAGMYGDFVMQVDDSVGRVLAALESAGQKEDTLVLFTSDNGPVWFPQDAKRYGHRSAARYRGMKGDAWEGGHRVPLLARWPGRIPAGAASAETACFTDMLATFARLTDQQLPEGAGEDSFDISPALLGRKSGRPLRPAVIHQSSRNVLAIREGEWKLIPQLGSGGFTQPAQETPKPGGPGGQLYNLTKDPGETQNVYAEHPEVVERLTGTLERLRSSGRSR